MKSKERQRLEWLKMIDDVANGRELPAMFEDASGKLCLACDQGGPFYGKQLPDNVIAAMNQHRPEIIAFAYWSRIARLSQERLNQRAGSTNR